MGYKRMILEQSDDDNVQDQEEEYVPTRSEAFFFGMQNGWGTIGKTIVQLFAGIIITMIVLSMVC